MEKILTYNPLRPTGRKVMRILSAGCGLLALLSLILWAKSYYRLYTMSRHVVQNGSIVYQSLIISRGRLVFYTSPSVWPKTDFWQQEESEPNDRPHNWEFPAKSWLGIKIGPNPPVLPGMFFISIPLWMPILLLCSVPMVMLLLRFPCLRDKCRVEQE